jgi:hypothetical protein
LDDGSGSDVSPEVPVTSVVRAGRSTSGFEREIPPAVSADPFERATVVLAYASVALVGLDLTVAYGASISFILGLLLLPLWVRSARRFSMATLLGAMVVVAVLTGVWLSLGARVDHAVDAYNRTASIAHVLSGVAATGLILWARRLMPLHRLIFLYGVGALINPLMHGLHSWKFDLAVPTTYLVLGAIGSLKSRVIPAATVFALGLVGIVADGRSYFGFCVLAATLTLLQIRPSSAKAAGRKESRRRKRARRLFPVLIIVGVGVGFYYLASDLLTSGALGEQVQQRSEMQVDATGSLLLGGRPEWAATWELMKMRPAGFGVGVVPSWTDLARGKSGLTKINVDTGGYANDYMFGGQFRMHSITADLWVSFGIPGLVLAVTIMVALIRSLSTLISERRAPTAVIFGCSLAVWYMAFGPIFTNWLDVCAALGFALLLKSEVTRPADDVGERDTLAVPAS